MNEYNKNNLFQPCDELLCYESCDEEAPECKYCEYQLLQNDYDKLFKEKKEILECLNHIYLNIKHFGSNISSGNAKQIIDKYKDK
jgi:hypothetical protein